jgi:hypothetical protein
MTYSSKKSFFFCFFGETSSHLSINQLFYYLFMSNIKGRCKVSSKEDATSASPPSSLPSSMTYCFKKIFFFFLLWRRNVVSSINRYLWPKATTTTTTVYIITIIHIYKYSLLLPTYLLSYLLPTYLPDLHYTAIIYYL